MAFENAAHRMIEEAAASMSYHKANSPGVSGSCACGRIASGLLGAHKPNEPEQQPARRRRDSQGRMDQPNHWLTSIG
jgi:hypothetical protein